MECGKQTEVCKMKGIDVSVHNGNIDWNRVKNAGIAFAILTLPQIPVNPLDYSTRICYNKTNSISKAVTLHDFSEYSEVLSRAT
jgi:hypothetical protein